MERRLGRVPAGLTAIEKAVAFICFLVMLLALIADVAGRQFFHQGIFGSVRVAMYGLILCAMAGFGLATATGGHLRPGFLGNALPQVAQGSAIRLGQIASAAILLILAHAAWKMVAFSILIDERDLSLDTPVWIAQMALPVRFVFSAFRHLCFAVFPALMPAPQGASE